MKNFSTHNTPGLFFQLMRPPYLAFIVGSFFLHACSEPATETRADELPNDSMLEPVSYLDVTLTDNFWLPKIETNRVQGIRSVFEKIEAPLNNFDIAAGIKEGRHVTGDYDDRQKEGYVTGVASDSDVYKILQGAAYSLHHHPDPDLEKYVDTVIDRIAAAQQSDGYLFTYWLINDPAMRWTDIEKKHELYCAGHLFEAGVAYYQVTGKRKLLDVAIKMADHVDTVFGPDKRIEVPGHQEIELALYKLYQVTGEKRYLNLAKFLVDERGNPERVADQVTPPENDPYANTPNRWRHPSYRQDHLPLEDQDYAVGHAVRAAYFYSSAADIALETNSTKYVGALDAIWEDIVQKKLYITGAIGTRQYHDEGFGDSYLLPNDAAYGETCSSIALTFWNRRMNLLHADTKYADMLELTMYNAGISGVSLDGDEFFYSNPMISVGEHQRRAWFNPACCPSNMVRFLPEIGGIIYAKRASEIFVNHFIASQATIKLEEGEVALTQNGNYPWEGDIQFVVEPQETSRFTLNIRIPGWARDKLLPGDLYGYRRSELETAHDVVVKVNGQQVNSSELRNGYVAITRNWGTKDTVELSLPMDIQYVTGNPNIEDAQQNVVLTRGPLVYCLEGTDNVGYFNAVNDWRIQPESFSAKQEKNLLRGVVTLNGVATLADEEEKQLSVKAIPYYAWNNRGKDHMRVWLPL